MLITAWNEIVGMIQGFYKKWLDYSLFETSS